MSQVNNLMFLPANNYLNVQKAFFAEIENQSNMRNNHWTRTHVISTQKQTGLTKQLTF